MFSFVYDNTDVGSTTKPRGFYKEFEISLSLLAVSLERFVMKTTKLHNEAAFVLRRVLSKRSSVKSAVLGGNYEVSIHS